MILAIIAGIGGKERFETLGDLKMFMVFCLFLTFSVTSAIIALAVLIMKSK